MKTIDELTQTVRITEKYPFYRADLFAACLREAGYDAEQIIITRKSEKDQGFLYDIEHIRVKYPNTNSATAYLEIGSGRAGMYDSLPEAIFHGANYTKRERDKKGIIQEMRDNREQEAWARCFFRLFEIEIDQLFTEMQVEELHYDNSHLYEHFTNMFAYQWEIMSLMTRCESLRFIRIIPYISSLYANSRATAKAISFVLNANIEICERSESVKIKDRSPRLSETRLGVNSVLVSKEVEQTVMKITVSGLSIDQCPDYFIGARKFKLICFFAELLLEANSDFKVAIATDSHYNHCYLGSTSPEHVSYLGVNTYL